MARKMVSGRSGKSGGVDKTIGFLSAAAMAIPLSISFYYSGLKGVLLLLLGFYAAYKVSRHLLVEVHLDKFIAIVFGVYFFLAAAVGLAFKAMGLEMSPTNFVVAFGLMSLVMKHVGRDRTKLVVDYGRLLPLAVVFIVCVAFYLYPTYPSFSSACVGGFDCQNHALYAESIHDEFRPVPPIVEWAHYPYGSHVNVALMAHAFSSSMNNENNFQPMRDFMYRFMAVVTAATIAVTCGLILDRGLHWLYAMFAAGFMLLGVYPASALMGHGFWTQIFGMFFVMLFGWAMGLYLKRPSAGSTSVLGMLAAGAFLSYQLITAVPVVMAFLLMLLVAETRVSDRLKHAAVFFALLGLFVVVDSADNYRVFLNYEGDIFGGGPNVYEEPVLTYEERHTLSWGSLDLFALVGKKQMMAGGSALSFSVKRFGLLAVVLAFVGLIYTARRQDHAALLFEAVVLLMLLFYVLYSRMNTVSSYYFYKIPYLVFYPLAAFAFVGLHEVVERSGICKRLYRPGHLAFAVFAILCVIYIMCQISTSAPELYQTVFGQSLTSLVWDMVTLESKNFGEYILQIC